MKKPLWIAVLLATAVATAQVPTVTISGEIRTREGRFAAGVRVSAMAVPEAGAPANNGTALLSISTTDSEGRYKLENVQPGRYYITAGFVDTPTYYPGASAVSGATVVSVLSGTPVTGINFTVANTLGVNVSGRVRRTTGTGGVAGQPVMMIGGSRALQQTTTAADGSFQFSRVVPGTYQLSSTAARTNPPVSFVVGDQDVTGIEIAVIPTVTVIGNVVIEGNGMWPRVQLQLSPFKGTGQTAGWTFSTSGTDGSFRGVLPEGDYRVSWVALPAGYAIKSVTSGGVDLLANALKLAVDAPPSPLRVLLSVDGTPWVKVSGRVTNFAANQSLLLTGPNVDQIQLRVNPDGSFEIPQILPGTYQVRLNPASSAILPTQPIALVIPNQDATNLIIPLPLMKEVQGVVANNSGAGVQGRISLSYSETRTNGSSSGSVSVATQADGKFAIQMPEGERRISVTAPGYNVKSVAYGVTDLTRENMKVSSTDTAELRVVLDTASTTITGGGGAGSLGGAVTGGVLGSVITSAPIQPLPQTIVPATAATNRISEALAKPNLVSSAPPAYPALARAARVQATVVLQIDLSVEGRVQGISVLTGHPLLNEAAIQAVRQWVYRPFVLNGQAIPVTTTATVDFKLQ
jgi:TonB family protein